MSESLGLACVFKAVRQFHLLSVGIRIVGHSGFAWGSQEVLLTFPPPADHVLKSSSLAGLTILHEQRTEGEHTNGDTQDFTLDAFLLQSFQLPGHGTGSRLYWLRYIPSGLMSTQIASRGGDCDRVLLWLLSSNTLFLDYYPALHFILFSELCIIFI